MRVSAEGASASSVREHSVLYISSGSCESKEVRDRINELVSCLKANVFVDYEFIDRECLYDDTAKQLWSKGLRYRLSQEKPYNVIVLGDDEALRFAMESRQELFPETPLVFYGVEDAELAEQAAKDSMIAGVIEKGTMSPTIDLGRKINPKAKRVVMILDNTAEGEVLREQFYELEPMYSGLEFEEINSSEYSREELKGLLFDRAKNSVMIYGSMKNDAGGNSYTIAEAVSVIAGNSRGPVLCTQREGVGTGLLGGCIASTSGSAESAAKMVMNVLNGERAGLKALVESQTTYLIDHKVMKDFHLKESLFPKNTVFINEKISYFERNREMLLPACALAALMAVVLGVGYYDNRRGRRVRKDLAETKTIMESASQHDFLTGLPNRSKFMHDLESLINAKKPCTVIMLDIDNFKKINDTYGHTAGDEALQQVASRMKEINTPTLSAYRYAGDEFIMIQQSDKIDIVEKTAQLCRDLFSDEFTLLGEKHTIYGSIGLARYPEDTEDLEELIVFADDAMYEVKKSGKNNYAFYHKATE